MRLNHVVLTPLVEKSSVLLGLSEPTSSNYEIAIAQNTLLEVYLLL